VADAAGMRPARAKGGAKGGAKATPTRMIRLAEGVAGVARSNSPPVRLTQIQTTRRAAGVAAGRM